MPEEQKTTIPTDDTGNTTNSKVENDFVLDLSDSSPQEGVTENEPIIPEEPITSTEDFSPNLNDDIQSPDLSEPKPTEEIQSPNLSEGNPTEEKAPENPLTENSTENQVGSPDSFAENLSNVQPDEPVNNEIPLGKFEDEPSTNITTDNEQINAVSNNGINNPSPLEQPTINENPLLDNPINTNLQNQENKTTAKEKLVQLVKTHESKAQKSGFIKGILSGVALTIVIVLAGFFFAKDQIFDLINKIDGSNQQLTANVVDITNTTDEEITPEDEIIDEDVDINDEMLIEDVDINDEMLIEDEEITPEDEIIDEELTDEDVYDETIMDEEESIDTNDSILDEDLITKDEDNQIDDSDDKTYNITHVDSEKEANWVLPSHCSDLTCYGEDKEFTPCTTFRLATNLDENANRIGKNGICKYKDSSELVFVEFN